MFYTRVKGPGPKYEKLVVNFSNMVHYKYTYMDLTLDDIPQILIALTITLKILIGLFPYFACRLT